MSTSTLAPARRTGPRPDHDPARHRLHQALGSRWASAALAVVLALVLLAAGPRIPTVDRDVVTGDAGLAAQVLEMLPEDSLARGIHVSVITVDSVRHAGIGVSDGQQYTQATPMETGSIAKTFVGQLMADAVERGEVSPSDTLETHVPELAGTPAGGTTLEDLAAHRSGMPGMPPRDTVPFLARAEFLGLNPFTDTAAELVDKTRTVELVAPGEFAYSNLGVSLLGEALTRAAGAASWQELLSERLLTPLGMEDTSLASSQAEVPAGAIHGTYANGRSGQSLAGPGYGPAGAGVWSTPADMARYARAVLAGTVPGGQAAQEARWDAGVVAGMRLPGEQVGWTWFVDGVEGRTVINHGGTTMEYMTHLAIDREAGTAVMVFTDVSADATASALAVGLLTGSASTGSARIPVPTEMVPQLALLTLFTVLLAVMGLYTAVRAESAPSRLAVACRTVALVACTSAAAASGPWMVLPTWVLAVAALPGAYGLIRGATAWSGLPALPRRRAWMGWTQLALTVAFAAVCVAVAWPKG